LSVEAQGEKKIAILVERPVIEEFDGKKKG